MPKLVINKESLNESTFFISRISIILVFYLILQAILPHSLQQLSIIICTLLFTTALSQTKMFQVLKNGISKYAVQINQIKEISVDPARHELLSSVYDIKEYLNNARKWNDRRRILFRKMTGLQQQLASSTKYTEKLNTVDEYFEKNNVITSAIVNNAIQKYEIQEFELTAVEQQARSSKRNNYFRVVESLCHYSRDWSVQENEEITPLLNYIKEKLQSEKNQNTTVIVPGSGLGKVAHTLASEMNFSSVHAIEFSWLMTLMNEFVYAKMNTGQHLNVYPFLHTYSNHLKTEDQFRSVEIQCSLKKPTNLSLHTTDFTQFDVKSLDSVSENVAFVTCFFLDTAENLVEYIQTINRISSSFKGTKKWVNVGPLKYGSAAQIELSDEELKILLNTMGWKIIDEQKPELLGYLTDKKGLWQGYYNVTKWTAVKES